MQQVSVKKRFTYKSSKSHIVFALISLTIIIAFYVLTLRFFFKDSHSALLNQEVIFTSVLILITVFIVYWQFLKQYNLVEEQAKELFSIIHNAPLGIYTINKEGFIDSFNPKMVELAGAKDETEVIGINALTLDTYKSVGLDKYIKGGLEGKSFETDINYISHSAEKPSWRHCLAVPLYAQDKKTVDHLLLLVEDISSRKKAEKEMREAWNKELEINKSKTEFLYLTSHQLRTPLSAMKWFTDMLLNDSAGKLNDDQKDIIKDVAEGTERMIDLVNSLLDLSRIETGKLVVNPQPTNLIELINNVIDELKHKFAEKNNLPIISMLSPLPKVIVDAELVRSVYTNLLTNAIKYTQNGGKIFIFVSVKENKIISQITDTGYGIPTKGQINVFKKLYRGGNVIKRGIGGSGLGLYLTKAIVEASKGKIWFKSEENKGTTFWFSLPAMYE